MKRRTHHFPLAAEIHEPRTLLSGSATATFANGTLTVDLHAGAKARVYEHAPNVFWVSPIGSVPINGADKPYVVPAGLANIVINMDPASSYDAREVFRLGYEGHQHSQFAGNVTVDEGGEYNRVYFEDATVAGNVRVNDAAYVEFENAPVGGQITVSASGYSS